MVKDLSETGTHKVRIGRCKTIGEFNPQNIYPECINVKDEEQYMTFPLDTLKNNDSFSVLARRIFYGTETILKPQPSFSTLVPNIGHMIWFGLRPMKFIFYLGVLSLLYVAKVDKVYIHGNRMPSGHYWIKLMENPNLTNRIVFVTIPEPLMVYQGEIEPHLKALMSDIVRIDIMIHYGGIYLDSDAVWVKPLTSEERGYDAVASFDWIDWVIPYPNIVNFGVSYGKRNAPFWRIFRESLRKLHNEKPGFTGVYMPYKLLEKYPHLLRIDPHLSAICHKLLCHPTWVKDYHNISVNHKTTGSLNNWREDLHALHWTSPDPPEFANSRLLKTSTGLFAEIGKMVLEKAGLL